MPQITSRELVAFFLKQRFYASSQTGSHLTLRHSDGRRVTVPVHAGDLGRGLVIGILKQGGYSADDFLRPA
jgi:predicted RNA binding protein YcfA (HicA-like mRNA interferase family)